MNYQTAKSITNAMNYIEQVKHIFADTDVFTSREYENAREEFTDLPILATLCAHNLVKVVKKEEFEIKTFEFQHTYLISMGCWCGYSTRCLDKSEVEEYGLDISKAVDTYIETGVRYYYQLDNDGINKLYEDGGKIVRYWELTEQIKKLEKELNALKNKRNNL